ncbi:hypothetical protein ACFW8Z_26600, partial [Streptomyces sp. NPDC059515]
MSRRTRTAQEEIRRFLAIGAVQVAEVDLHGDEAGLRPGPGSPPVTHGEVFALVRRDGRPAGTLLGHVPPGADPRTVLARLAREAVPDTPADGPTGGEASPTGGRTGAEAAPGAEAGPGAGAGPGAPPYTTVV